MKISEKKVLGNSDSFVLFRLPGESSSQLFIQSGPDGTSKDLSEGTGFVLHPFYENLKHKIIFIRADHQYQDPDIEFSPGSDNLADSTDKTTYMSLVDQFIQTTQTGPGKLVLSRIFKINNNEKDLFDTFKRLDAAYPTAFVYLVNHPVAGTWMGATPEKFIVGEGDQYSTMALAGTKLNKEPEASAPWSLKDINEQQIVCDHIEDIFKALKITFVKTGPSDHLAGKLLHIKTDYHFEKPLKLTILAKHLHPTPAVCGLPKEEALKFILKHEPHDREYYTGYLGPVNFKNSISLYVNLRCMKISSESMLLFVGGGIIPQSDPEKEWNETENKLTTLMDILRS